MMEAPKIVEALFQKLKEDIYVLMRIEVLVALVTVMFVVMCVLDIFHFHYRWSSMNTVFSILDSVSDQIVFYLLGAMRTADFEKQLFPVWGLVLVSLRASLGYLSGYGLVDQDQRLTEVSNVLRFIGTGVLSGTRSVGFTRPLWSLWAILQLRGVYRFMAHGRAAKSLWHGRSSEFLPEYLREKQQNYLVYGETEQEIEIKRPEYILQLKNTDADSLITLNKIQSKCSDNPDLTSRDHDRYMDMSLAFSLSRLLRCRLEDVALPSDSIKSTKNRIIKDVIGNLADAQNANDRKAGARKMFKILELELAFVRDYFYSLYPVIFWRGLSSLSFSIFPSAATLAVTLWLAVDIRSLYELTKEEEEVVLLVGSVNFDVIATWVFMFFMMVKEVWEMTTYLLSNWTRLLLVCKYARKQNWFLWSSDITNGLTRFVFSSKIVNPWHRRMDQYEFLKSCTFKPTFSKLLHYGTLGKTAQKLDGRESGDAIKIQDCVLVAVQEELQRCILNRHSQEDYRNIPSLRDHEIFERYEWALCKLKTCSQSILVWNIATSLCEIKLAADKGGKGTDHSKPSFLRSVWLWFKKLVSCSSHQFLLGDSVNELQDELRTNYLISNSLSRYCGYLLAFQCELLPDSYVVPDLIFETTIEHATENLKECDLTRCKYNAFMALAALVIEDGILNADIVQQGARLAKDLINEEEGVRWKILAEVWTKLLVNIAPSWKAEAHKKSIKSRGEFITLIWALLWHCGIDKNTMWPEGSASRENTTSAHQTRDPENTTTAHQTRDPDNAEEQETEGEIQKSEESHTDMITEEQMQKENGAGNIVSPITTRN